MSYSSLHGGDTRWYASRKCCCKNKSPFKCEFNSIKIAQVLAECDPDDIEDISVEPFDICEGECEHFENRLIEVQILRNFPVNLPPELVVTRDARSGKIKFIPAEALWCMTEEQYRIKALEMELDNTKHRLNILEKCPHEHNCEDDQLQLAGFGNNDIRQYLY